MGDGRRGFRVRKRRSTRGSLLNLRDDDFASENAAVGASSISKQVNRVHRLLESIDLFM